LRAVAYTLAPMRSFTPALAVMIAGAALMLGAAIAWAKAPPARGGHAVTIVPRTAKPKHGPLVGRPKSSPAAPATTAPAAPIATVAPTPTPAEPVIATPGGRPAPTFTVTQTGNTVTLDASASPPCRNGGCDFSWRVYSASGNRLGATIGFGPVVTYTLPAAGVYQVVLTESEYCAPGGGSSLRSCPGVAQQTVTAA
jgi:hypothetical protein